MARLLSNLQLHQDTALPRFTGNIAVVVFPGKHQVSRIQEAARVLRKVESPNFWVAGTMGDPFYPRRDILKEMEDAAGDYDRRYRSSPWVETGGFANNSLDQAKFVLELLRANPEVTHLILSTAAYHLPRCVLTCIKQMIEQDKRVAIYTAPSGDDISQGNLLPGTPEIEEEILKILRYQRKGDVATWDELQRYLAWRALEIVRLKPDLR
ncbi:MAG: ElyC/SanA/YdcF family protein [bacterium]|nr:ElyC/SanA/YdcF family protein [bacterium]